MDIKTNASTRIFRCDKRKAEKCIRRNKMINATLVFAASNEEISNSIKKLTENQYECITI